MLTLTGKPRLHPPGGTAIRCGFVKMMPLLCQLIENGVCGWDRQYGRVHAGVEIRISLMDGERLVDSCFIEDHCSLLRVISDGEDVDIFSSRSPNPRQASRNPLAVAVQKCCPNREKLRGLVHETLF